MKINVKLNMPNLTKLANEAAKKVEVAFNADLRRLKANRGAKSDEQVAREIRALAGRHGITLNEATVAEHSRSE